MSLQTYSSINWIEEAARVGRAFGVEGECKFVHRYFGTDLEVQYNRPITADGPPSLSVLYYDDYKSFSLSNPPYVQETDVTFYENGEVAADPSGGRALEMARALFHLDLLTIEVENALCVSISAHEKLEWGREYDRKYGETI